MKFPYLLLLSASCVLIQSTSTLGLPVRTRSPGTQVVAASRPTADTYQTCQQAIKAVATLYSDVEIGSGSIIDTDGTILTAYHVVKAAVSNPNRVKIYVKLANGNRYIGRAIAADKSNDLALVQIPVQEALPTLQLASATSPPAGQKVCAIGSPSGRTGVLSQGTFKTLSGNGDLQSALRLTYGNSGGPLLNPNGELIGVNKSIWLSERGENTGISFATSARVAQTFIDQHHRIASSGLGKPPAAVPILQPVQPSPATVAAKVQPLPPMPARVAASSSLGATFDERTMTVQQVEFGSPADMGGLQPGDRLTAINGRPLKGVQELQAVLAQQPTTAVLTINRHQQVANVQVNF